MIIRAVPSPNGPGSNAPSRFQLSSVRPIGRMNASSITPSTSAEYDPPTLHHGDTSSAMRFTNRSASQMPAAAGAATKTAFSVFTPSTCDA